MVTGHNVPSAGLRIAGIPIRLHSVLPLAKPLFPEEYASFRDLLEDGQEPAIQVELVPEIPADAACGERVADTGPWCLYRNGDIRVIVWYGPDKKDPLWAASLDAPIHTIRVWCGGKCLVRSAGRLAIRNPFRYPLDQLVLMFHLAHQGQCIVHAGGLVCGDQGVVAAGRSGAGKSTISRLWSARHGSASLLSDDRVIVGRGLMHGTPWPGELGVAANISCKLEAVVFLEKAGGNRLVPLSSREAVERLMPVASVLWFDPDYLARALVGIEQWIGAVPAYEFRFTPDERGVVELEKVFTGGAG